jgi:hypothetical protein
MIVTYETFEHPTGTEEVAVLHNEDGSYTSMLKSTYDEMIAAQSTPSIPEGGN